MAGEGIGQIRQAVRDGDSICKGCIQKKYAAKRTRQVLYYVGAHSSILQLQPQIALRINGNFHLTDVLVIKPPFLTGAHLGAGGPVDLLKQLPHVEMHQLIQTRLQLAQQGAHTHLIAVSGAEIIDVTVENACVLHGMPHTAAELVILHHNQKLGLRQHADERPIITVAGQQHKAVGSAAVKLPADPHRQRHVGQALFVLQALEHGLVQQGQCDALHTGTYCVFVYDYGFTGFRKSNLTQYIIVDCQNGEVLIPEETIWKQLLNSVVQTRNALPTTYEEYLKFKELADAASDENAQEFKTTMARGNDVKISSRIQALRRLSQARVDNYQKDLQTASAANKERLMKSIERDRKRTEDKIDELEKRKLLGVSTAFQSVLILEVV